MMKRWQLFITFTAVGTLCLTCNHTSHYFNTHLGREVYSYTVGKADKYEDTAEFALLRNTAETNYQ
jgi:hypothetical protein